MTTTPFEDTSGFQDIIEFATDTGEHVRAMRQEKGVYEVYVKQGAAYIRQARVRVRGHGKVTPLRIWQVYLVDSDEAADDEQEF